MRTFLMSHVSMVLKSMRVAPSSHGVPGPHARRSKRSEVSRRQEMRATPSTKCSVRAALGKIFMSRSSRVNSGNNM